MGIKGQWWKLGNDIKVSQEDKSGKVIKSLEQVESDERFVSLLIRTKEKKINIYVTELN